MEQTLVIVKPDGVTRGLIGEIINRFERAGLKLVAAKLLHASQELASKHYPADRTELWEGIGNKTLKNYQSLNVNPHDLLGTDNPKEIGAMVRVWLLEYISQGPVFAAVLEGPHAVELVRKIAGNTLPSLATPGTIRGDFSYDSAYLANTGKRAIKNLVHASGTIEEAQYEIPLWFSPNEFMNYERTDEKAMR